MLIFVDVRVDPKGMSQEDLWEAWEEEAILDVESHDELDRIWMGALPMAHYLELKEVLPIREYEAFADDVRQRWQQ